MIVDFYSSAFCAPCMITRSVLSEARRVVAAMELFEHDVQLDELEAQRRNIRSTPTVIISSSDGEEVFRAEGVPSLGQVLAALAKAA